MPLDTFCFQGDMNGTILLQSQNADGSVQVSAKASVLATQSFDAYAWDNHVIGYDTIPVEICYSGSGVMSTAVSVLVYGKPYSGPLRLQTAAGKDTVLDISDGALENLSIYDIRRGLAVTVEDEATGHTLIGSYRVEDYPMFSLAHLKALVNLFFLLVLIGSGCSIICMV